MNRPRKFARWQARRTEAVLNAELARLGYQDTAVRLRAAHFIGRGRSVPRAAAAALACLRSPIESKRWDRAARWVNRRLARPFTGLPICDGEIECPRCRRNVPTAADPQEWTRTVDRRWEVLSYWGGTAECCDTLLAFQPDGRAEGYAL